MTVIMFQHRFAPLVKAGTKTQTIRPRRKRPLKIGQLVSLRQWSDLPYRSPQIELAVGEVTFLCHIIISHQHVIVTQDIEVEELAKADGFNNWNEMEGWFARTHGLPFDGTLIKWKIRPRKQDVEWFMCRSCGWLSFDPSMKSCKYCYREMIPADPNNLP